MLQTDAIVGFLGRLEVPQLAPSRQKAGFQCEIWRGEPQAVPPQRGRGPSQ